MARSKKIRLKDFDIFEDVVQHVETINPAHYKGVYIENMETGKNGTFEVADIVYAFASENLCRGTALIYLLRAGKKEGSSVDEDIQKAIWWLRREIGLTYDPSK